jgi:hypothetical protein
MRESGLWVYPITNLLHVFGIAALFGSVLVIDLRLMGLWRRVPLAPLTAIASPIAVAGFALAAPTGIGLLVTNATEYAGNPYLLIKFPAIFVGLLNVAILNLTPAWRARGTRELTSAERRQLAVMGGVSLSSWTTALAAGRLIAYW